MPYTVEDGGRLNNFAKEPKVYLAEPPSNTQRRNYVIAGIGAIALIVGLMSVAFLVS